MAMLPAIAGFSDFSFFLVCSYRRRHGGAFCSDGGIDTDLSADPELQYGR